MRVVVLGSGVIGTTTAYYLARAGHEVTVIDRQPGPAMETSHANAGQLSYGYAAPWAAPGIPGKALKWMLQRHAPLSIKPDGTLFQLRWLWQMLENCGAARYAVNKDRMVRLAEYSRACLARLRSETGIAYEGRQKGTLQLFRTQRQLDEVARDIEVLKNAGVAFRLLERDELRLVEPALHAVRDKLVGGLHLPDDETGDCHLFTTRLAALAKELGVRFAYGAAVEALAISGDKIDGALCRSGHVQADAYVVALGSFSRALLQPFADLPVYPVKGYSITAPILDAASAPVSTILDETYKIAITRFDNRIRVGGMAEIAGFDTTMKARRRHTLQLVLTDLFPEAANLSGPGFWAGLRPMTPDGTPLVGATSLRNLFVNTGHGTLGWTMSCGSAQLLSDLISGKKPAICADDLSLARYSGRNAAFTRPATG